MLSCIFEQIGANLAHIQAENLQNVQKMHVWQKALGINVLNSLQSAFYPQSAVPSPVKY